jgi:hypothetical protein
MNLKQAKRAARNTLRKFTKFGHLPENIEPADVPLNRVEVFVAGDYNEKGAWDADFLKALAETYNPGEHEAPVTLDHAQSGPSYGWVQKVFAEGKQLFMDMVVTPSMAHAIKAGAFKKRSIEFYENFLNSGKPMVRAITFCGAAIPHSKGMEDIKFSEAIKALKAVSSPIKFADDAGEFKQVDSPNSPVVIPMAEMPYDPWPNDHDVICCEDRTGQTLGHWHEAHMDEEGNGFTGDAMGYDDEYWSSQALQEGDQHQHQIVAGVVQVGGPDPGHVHDLTTIQRYSENKSTGAQPAKEPPVKIGPKLLLNPSTQGGGASSPDAPTAQQFSEVMKRVETLETDAKTFTEKLADAQKKAADTEAQLFAERAINAFDKVFEKAVDQFRVDPGKRQDYLDEYLFIEPGTKKFGEREVDGRGNFLKRLSEMPVQQDLSKRITKPGDGGAGERQEFGENPNNTKLHDEAVKFSEENKVSYREAVDAVTRKTGMTIIDPK